VSRLAPILRRDANARAVPATPVAAKRSRSTSDRRGGGGGGRPAGRPGACLALVTVTAAAAAGPGRIDAGHAAISERWSSIGQAAIGGY
jgi:hypothetical protein